MSKRQNKSRSEYVELYEKNYDMKVKTDSHVNKVK